MTTHDVCLSCIADISEETIGFFPLKSLYDDTVRNIVFTILRGNAYEYGLPAEEDINGINISGIL